MQILSSSVDERCFQHEKIKSVSSSGHVIFFILYEIFTVKRNFIKSKAYKHKYLLFLSSKKWR